MKNSAQELIRLEKFKQQIVSPSSKELNQLMDAHQLHERFEQALATDAHLFRDCVWTPITTFLTFIYQQLSHGSCQDAVIYQQVQQIRAREGLCSSNTSAYCQARQRLPLQAVEQSFRYSANIIEQQTAVNLWRNRPVKLIDGSTLSMSDTPANQAEYPQESNQAEGLGFPIARIGIVSSLNHGGILDYRLAPYSGKGTGESALFNAMLPHFKAGDIALLDSYYDSYWTFAFGMQQGIDLLTPKRGSRKMNWRAGTELGSRDRLLTWRKPQRPKLMAQEIYDSLPNTLQVRAFQVYGDTYISTFTDSKAYKKKALRLLYRSRWSVELDLREIKRTMNMEPMRCKTPEMVRKEIAVTLLAYNLIRLLMLQAAQKHHTCPRGISFQGALTTFIILSHDLLTATAEHVQQIWNGMLKMMAGQTLRNALGRHEPRAIKRRKTKRYPYLSRSRSVEKAKIEQEQKLCEALIDMYFGEEKIAVNS